MNLHPGSDRVDASDQIRYFNLCQQIAANGHPSMQMITQPAKTVALIVIYKQTNKHRNNTRGTLANLCWSRYIFVCSVADWCSLHPRLLWTCMGPVCFSVHAQHKSMTSSSNMISHIAPLSSHCQYCAASSISPL